MIDFGVALALVPESAYGARIHREVAGHRTGFRPQGLLEQDTGRRSVIVHPKNGRADIVASAQCRAIEVTLSPLQSGDAPEGPWKLKLHAGRIGVTRFAGSRSSAHNIP